MAAECADLMYFAMTRCVAAGVTVDQVEAHLDRRSLKLQRRPGNDKKERIDAAAAILAGKHAAAAPAPAPAAPRGADLATQGLPKWAPYAVAVVVVVAIGLRRAL